MGTRKSRHNRGRKPLYKEHGALLARMLKQTPPSPADLEREADKLLRANGSADLVDGAFTTFGDGQLQKKPVALEPFKPYGTTPRGIPTPNVYKPKGDTRVAKKLGDPCPGCGNPKSKYSTSPAAVCRACYLGEAVKRHDVRVIDKWKRAEIHVEKYSFLVANYLDYWLEFYRFAPDPTNQFIDDVSRWEEYLGIPLVFWNGALQFDQGSYEWEPPDRPAKTASISRVMHRNKMWVRQLQTAWRYE